MFRIRPFEKNLTAGEYHCCIDGKTPTEITQDPADPTAIVETVVDNGDGTHTTTWQTPSAITAGGGDWTIEFNVCCKGHYVLTSSGDPGCVDPAEGFVTWDFLLNDVVLFQAPNPCEGYTKVIEDQSAVPAGTFPLGPCGAHMMIKGFGLWTITMTI